jgi:hypothetical protein
MIQLAHCLMNSSRTPFRAADFKPEAIQILTQAVKARINEPVNLPE